MPTVSAHVAHTLSAHIDHVFGVMGNGNAYFLDALERETDVGYTAVRHEAGGVVAADAYFRASGRLAAATSTYGAGFTNTLTSLAEAAQARVPLVLVVGDEPTSGRRPWDVDQIALASAVGARTYTVGRTDAAATTVIAIEHALTYRVPTVLAIPYDVAALDAGAVPDAPEPRVPRPVGPRGPFAMQAVRDVAAALAGAKRPFLLARHGASLNQFTMRFGALFAPGTRVFQVDLAPAATHPHVGGYVRGDAALVARAIADELTAIGAASSGWRESADVASARAYEPGDALAAD